MPIIEVGIHKGAKIQNQEQCIILNNLRIIRTNVNIGKINNISPILIFVAFIYSVLTSGLLALIFRTLGLCQYEL